MAAVTGAGGAITVLVGTVVLRLTLTGTYTRYVRPGMAPWLVATGVVVIALGLITLARTWRSARPAPAPAGGHGDHADGNAHAHGDHGHGHSGESELGDGHDHEHGSGRVGWLLLAPIAALLLVAPPALGSYGVDRGTRLDIRAGASDFEPLPTGGRPVPLTLLEFSQRAFDHDGASLDGATIQLTGFVAGDDDAEPGGSDDRGFHLARYQIACCAGDAAPVVVRVAGTQGDPPRRDRWVTVTGTFRPAAGGDVPQLAAVSVAEIPEPDDPYE